MPNNPSQEAMRFAIKWSQAIAGNDPFRVQLLAKAYDDEIAQAMLAERARRGGDDDA